MRFRIGEIFFGALMAMAIFAAGYSISSPAPRAQNIEAEQTKDDASGQKPPQDGSPDVNAPWWLLTEDQVIAYGTVVIAAFTVVLGIGTLFLVRDGRTHSRHALRAYLSARAFWVNSFDDKTQIVVKFLMSNHGTTPATDMVHSAVVLIMTYPLPEGLPFPELPDFKSSKSTVFADGPLEGAGATSEPPTPVEIAAIRDGSMRVYVFGKIDYRDIFRRPRWTRFCICVVPSEGLTSLSKGLPDKVEITFEAANQHNEIK